MFHRIIYIILWIPDLLFPSSLLGRVASLDDQQHLFVMRYRPEHKLETHKKIVKDASERVRAEGLNGAAVLTVMRDAGLTHGGFYNTSRARTSC